MPVDQFDTNFGHLSPSEFVITLGNFADSLIDHPFFKDNWPDYLTHPRELKEQLSAYNDAVRACEIDGGKKNLKVREERREAAHAAAILMGQYVVMRSVSENKPSFLNEVALRMKARASRSSFSKGITLGAATITVKHGDTSGSVIVRYSRVPGAGTTEVQMCEEDPHDEAAWKTVGQYKNCRADVSGLTPGSKVSFRVRCHGTGEPGPFSQIVSIIVL